MQSKYENDVPSMQAILWSASYNLIIGYRKVLSASSNEANLSLIIGFKAELLSYEETRIRKRLGT